MNFEIPKTEPNLTKDFILSKISDETIMSTYLGYPIKKGLVRSIFRSDKYPTCSVYRSKSGLLKWHDFATNQTLNCFEVVMEKYNCKFNKALRIIAEDFNLVERNSDRSSVKIINTNQFLEEKTDTTIQITPKSFTEQELKWWKSFNISEKTLKKYRVFSCDSVFLNGDYFGSSSVKSSMYGYYCGKKQGVELWRIYMPQKKSFRFLSNTSKNFIQGSKYLPDTGDLLVITKSMKDVMCLYEFNIPAIAPCSEVLFLSNIQLNSLKKRFKKIIVFYDNDLPGIKGMNRIKKEHPELLFFWIPRKYNAKDCSDFVKKYGIAKTQEYITMLKNFYEN